MSEEQNLRKAYFILGLEPGSPLDTINRRYKRLIMVWHPDRFPTADGKNDAEEELKQINNAKDKLKAHFDAGHKPTGPCACKPTAHGSGAPSVRILVKNPIAYWHPRKLLYTRQIQFNRSLDSGAVKPLVRTSQSGLARIQGLRQTIPT